MSQSKFIGQKTKSEYPFARAFAVSWFSINKLPLPIDASAKHIAMRLGLVCKGSGNGCAKKAIIEWHLLAIKKSSEPAVDTDEDFYSTQAWRKVRYEALRLCGGRCVLCGSPPGKHSLHVDHIKPRSLFPKLALDLQNLQVLCRDCNLGKSNHDSIDWREPEYVDAEGEYSDREIGKMLNALH